MDKIKKIKELLNFEHISAAINGGELNTYQFSDTDEIENFSGNDRNTQTDTMSLPQIIDLNAFISLLENISNLAQISCEFIDTQGEILLAPQKETICSEFHRKHPGSLSVCQRNHDKMIQIGFENGYAEHTCQKGLTDIIMPVHIQGKFVGTFFIGPFFKERNENFSSEFKQQAVKFGIDEFAYTNALAEVPVLSDESISYVINIFSGLINLFKSIARQNLAIANEIKERNKQNCVIREAKRKAEESDKLKSAFLANMSHEIRTPMNSIIGFSELMTRESISDEERLCFIAIIKESGQNLLELIDDIIDLSRIEANQIIIRNRDFDVNELIIELQSIFAEQSVILKKPHIELIVDPTNSESLILCSDRLRIKQILSNLLRNAYKFSDRGSIHFGCYKKEHEFIFYVKDYGIGITKEQQEFIFDRFRQGENSLNRRFGGAGLGLSIAKDLSNLLGGRIWVESEIETGSTFFFSVSQKTNVPLKEFQN